MTINVHWDNDDHQLVIAEFESAWEWNDFHNAVREMHQLVASVNHKVDLMLWHKVTFPEGRPFIHFQNAMKSQPDNTGKIVVVNTGVSTAFQMFMKSLATVTEKLYPNKSNVIFVKNIEEARAVLQKQPRIEV